MTYVQKSSIKDEVQEVELLALTATYWYCKVTDFLKKLVRFLLSLQFIGIVRLLILKP